MIRILRVLGRPLFLLDRNRQTVDYVNGPGEELLGASARELIGRSWKDFFDEISARRIEALLDILQGQITADAQFVEGRQELQLILRRKTRRPVTVNLIVTPIENQGRSYWLFDLEDLTPILDLQKEKEELLNEMSRVSKLADIGRLTGGIAHELNNPLAILQGFIENMEMTLDEGAMTPESLRADLDPMKQTLNRMIRIIRSMMSVARGEEPQMENLALAEVWTRATAGFRGLVGSENVKMKVFIDPQLKVQVDSIRIEQVLMNLVKNAVEALQENPTSDRRLEIRAEERSTEIQLEVMDSGPGVPAELVEHLFTPFFTTKPVGKGTGLGLFLCYNIMKAHGGSLTYQKSAGTGARFILTFPKPKSRPVLSHIG